MKVYLATWLFEKTQGEALTNKKNKNRLLSYFHTKQKKEHFKKYVKTGRNNEN